MGEARVRSVLAMLVAAAPLLAGCIVPDAPFDTGARPQTLAGSPSPAPRTPTLRPPSAAPVYSVPHSAPPVTGEPPAQAASGAASSALATTPGPADTCGATELAYLVGKSRTEIPIPADLTRRQVVCTTCPLSPEVRSERQTITYDSATKLVTKVACG